MSPGIRAFQAEQQINEASARLTNHLADRPEKLHARINTKK